LVSNWLQSNGGIVRRDRNDVKYSARKGFFRLGGYGVAPEENEEQTDAINNRSEEIHEKDKRKFYNDGTTKALRA